ncbi:MAG: SpaH/EbpB family LPXTG-anchored major pilin [Parabacteroides gordonii]|nr:SpaH/EbpB family LPXTG-anchored major pilin [Parabacteroides gordonii]
MRKMLKKVGAAVLAAACAVVFPLSAMAGVNDIIDTTKTGSITLHKYDFTAAEEDGIDRSKYANNGKEDATAESELANYVIEGCEFTYLRVGDINTETVSGEIKVLYDIPSELESILGLTDSRGDHKHSSDELNTALANLLSDNTAGKNALEEYIVGDGTAMALTDENGVTSVDNLQLGLYLIVETTVPANVTTTVDPFFVSVPMTDNEGDEWFYDIEVYPKNQTGIPDLNKLVRQNDDVSYGDATYYDSVTASEGDVLDYIFVSHLPRITSESTYLTQYQFVDVMDAGITYNEDAAIYFYNNVDDANANNTANAVYTWKHGSRNFSETYKEVSSTENQMTIATTSTGLAEINTNVSGSDYTAYSELWMVVAYTGTVNSDATAILGDTGNTNDVELTWSRTSMDYIDQLEDRCRVYTFGINLTKTFEDAAGDATAVQFVLQNSTDGHYITATSSTAGVYYVTDATKGAEESEGTVFSPASDGTMIINGLEANTYILTEIMTDDGYSLLKEPITIVITCTDDDFTASVTTLYDLADAEANPNKEVIEVNNDRASATVDGNATAMSEDGNVDPGSTNARVDMTVENTQTFTLPQTGGLGTILFTLAGCAVIFIGIVVLTKSTRKAA